MCIAKQHISDINNKIKGLSLDIDKKNIKRNRKLHFKDCLLYMCHYIYDKKSHDVTLDHLKNLSMIGDVSITAIKKKINNYGYETFNKLNNELLKLSYSKYQKSRIIAIDGSRLSLPLKLKNEGFALSKNGNYTKGYLSVLFDVDKQIPISSVISKKRNEPLDLKNQLMVLNEKDIIVGDRGYPTKYLLKELQERNINYVFRVSTVWDINKYSEDFIDDDYDEDNDENYDFHNNLNNDDINVKLYKNICDKHIFFDEILNIKIGKKNYNLRMIKYMIGDKDYCIITNMFYVDSGVIQYIYYKRWEIETFFTPKGQSSKGAEI